MTSSYNTKTPPAAQIDDAAGNVITVNTTTHAVTMNGTVRSNWGTVQCVKYVDPADSTTFGFPVWVFSMDGYWFPIVLAEDRRGVEAHPEPGGALVLITDMQPAVHNLAFPHPGAWITISINAAQAVNKIISLSSSNPASVTVPANATVLAGQTTVSVTFGQVALGSAVITATLGNSTKQSTVNLVA